jgi:hypothetical protein
MDITCGCGRIWELSDQKWPERDPGVIICVCGKTIHEWHGSRTWTAKLAKGLLEDEGKEIRCTYK